MAKASDSRPTTFRRLRASLGHLTQKGLGSLKSYQRLLVLSLITGLSTAAMALVLKFLVHQIEVMILGFSVKLPIGGPDLNLVSFFTPAIGMGLTILLVRFAVKADLSHGVSAVLRSIAVKDARMPRWSSWAYVAACSLTSGFGGSVGMEAPMLATGAGIGSNLGTASKSDYRERVILMACGAAAAVAAIFKAPIAGLIIALEVLAMDSAATAILPIIVASASGAVLSMVFTDQSMTFSFAIHENFHMQNIPWYLILGVICGLISVYYTRLSYWIDRHLKSLKPVRRFILGSLLVGLLVWLFPPLFGEGYDAMKYLLGGWQHGLLTHTIWVPVLDQVQAWGPSSREILFLALIAAMVLLKALAASITLSAGGVGGIFAPSLLMGCMAGYVFAHGMNLSGITTIPESNFALVGMAAVLGGVMHAPLSGIFLIAEITGGYTLFIPLMICVGTAVFTAKRFESHSIYTKKLAQNGELMSQERDRSALELLRLKTFIKPDSLDSPADSLTQGIRTLLGASPLAIRETMSVKEVADAFLDADEIPSHLPVVDQEGRYVGYLNLAELLAAYRENIIRMSSGDSGHKNADEPPDRLT